MLFTAGIEVTCYDMEGALPPEDDAGKSKKKKGGRRERQMVVTLQHGWRGYEVRDFLLKQPEVTAVEWDNVKTVPDRLLAHGGGRAGSAAGAGSGVDAPAGAPRAKGKKGKKGARRRAAAAGGAAGGPEL
jgi:hypothetical protein